MMRMPRLKLVVLMGIVSATAGCAETGKTKGKIMNQQLEKVEVQLEQIAKSHKDLFNAPTEAMKSEIDFKILDVEWEGEYVAAPEVVDASQPYIPIIVLTRRSSLREWEVRLKKNAYVIAEDLDRGEIWIRALEKPPTKRLKPLPDVKGRKPEREEGHIAGSTWFLVGDSRPDPLPQGEYVVTLITYDHISNQRHIKKLGSPKSIDPATVVAQWPWDRWSDTKPYAVASASPSVLGNEGIAVAVSGAKTGRKLAGSLIAKARPVHLILPDPKRAAHAGIQAGIHVDLLLFTLDLPPKVVRIDVPILGSSPIKAGDEMKGYFNLPFPFEPSAEDRMLYAVAGGNVIGPVIVPGEKP
jgi:hypothetical protein